MAAFHTGGLKDSFTKGLEWTSALQMGLFSERCPINSRKLQDKNTPWTWWFWTVFKIHVFKISKPHPTGLNLKAVPEEFSMWFEHSSIPGASMGVAPCLSALAVWVACATHAAGS